MAPNFSWMPGFNSNLILSKIAAIRTVDGAGCSFNSGEYQYWLPVLNSAVRALHMSDRLKSDCIRKAVSDVSLTLRDPAAFLLGCRKAFDTLASRTKSDFILFSTMTYTGPKLTGPISDGQYKIVWQPNSRDKAYRKAREARRTLDGPRKARNIPEADNSLTDVLVYVSAYDPFDAFQEANDCIDKLRGMLNLLVNSTNSINPFGHLSTPHAVNRFRRGPFHTMHRSDGSLATETFWFEPRWEHSLPPVKFSDGHLRFRKQFLGWWRKLRVSRMNDFTSDILLKYCRALDLHQSEAALLGMWQVLERFTGTDKYDVLINRVTRLFKDHEDARELANHLRVRRNSTVHSSHDLSGEANAVLLQVETLAGQAIFFCLSRGSIFNSLNEMRDFLDFALDQSKLLRQQELCKLFIRHQNR